MLATLEDLKLRLGIPEADVSQDNDLVSALSAASDKILDVCGYVENDTAAIVEILRNVQQSREYRTKIRPVAAVDTDGGFPASGFLVEGRGHGTTFLKLSADLLDPASGTWMILGAAEWWPPNYVEERRPKFRRWREPTWPVVRVTYDATGIGSTNAPNALREATMALAIYWRGHSQNSAVKKITIGQLSQEFVDFSSMPFPDSVKSLLGKHYRGVGATWVR